MLSLALTVAVLSSSGGLLSGYESQHVRLIDAAEVIGGAALGQQGQSVDQMKQHLADLEDSLPGFVLPIVLMGAGVATEILGLVLAGISYYGALYWVGWVLYVLAGPALIIVGGIILIVTIVKRVKITREIRSVERQIQAAESGGGGYQPLPTGPTPPPPPTSLLSTPTSSMVLAEF
jgi:hypothetical protein